MSTFYHEVEHLYQKEWELKNQILSASYTEVDAAAFYSYIFPPDCIESASKSEGRANPVYGVEVLKTNEDGTPLMRTIKDSSGAEYSYQARYLHNKVMTNSYDFGRDLKTSDFCVCGLYTSYGRSRNSKSGWELYGFAFDIDGVKSHELKTFLMGVDMKIFPQPTFIVNSGHGIHAYYIFEVPVPLYPQFKRSLNRLKEGLTHVLWTKETTDEYAGERQIQGIYQGMRMVGSKNKWGKGRKKTKYVLRAFKTGERVDLTYLNHFVADEYAMRDYKLQWHDYSSEYDQRTPLAEAKELWPQWYQDVVVDGKKSRKYICPRALYQWWLDKLWHDADVADGFRYYCVSVLFVMAIKCDVPFEEVEQDALNLVDHLDRKTVHGHFTASDVIDAECMYDEKWARMSIRHIIKKTGLKVEPRKDRKNVRNGRPLEVHLKRARALRSFESYENVGRPDKQSIVKTWRAEHPDGSKSECSRETRLSRTTVTKWWDA